MATSKMGIKDKPLSTLGKLCYNFYCYRQGWVKINMNTIVRVTVHKLEEFCCNIPSYKQMTNRKPCYKHVHYKKFVSAHNKVQDYKRFSSYTPLSLNLVIL